MTSLRLAFALLFAIEIATAQVADMSGTWHLNVQKSSWGKHPKPTSGTVVIEHHEPAFKYPGNVDVDNGTETSVGKRNFAFDGAIDGKEYPVSGSAAGAEMTLRRVNPNTIVSELKATDGTVIETAKTTISADGKQLTRELKATAPGKELSWTEVYYRH
jgi:hypothetical protein